MHKICVDDLTDGLFTVMMCTCSKGRKMLAACLLTCLPERTKSWAWAGLG